VEESRRVDKRSRLAERHYVVVMHSLGKWLGQEGPRHNQQQLRKAPRQFPSQERPPGRRRLTGLDTPGRERTSGKGRDRPLLKTPEKDDLEML